MQYYDTSPSRELQPPHDRSRVWLPDNLHSLPLSPGAKRIFVLSLAARGGWSLSRLGQALGVRRSTASRWWGELVKAGLALPAERGRGARAKPLKQSGGGGMFWVPSLWVSDPGISEGEFSILLSLCRHADGRGRCFVSNSHLSSDCGLSERTVKRHLKSLEEKGLVVRRRWRGRRILQVLSQKCCTGDPPGGRKCCTGDPPLPLGPPPSSHSDGKKRGQVGGPRNSFKRNKLKELSFYSLLRARDKLDRAAELIGGRTLQWWKELPEERRFSLAEEWLRGDKQPAGHFILQKRIEELKGGSGSKEPHTKEGNRTPSTRWERDKEAWERIKRLLGGRFRAQEAGRKGKPRAEGDKKEWPSGDAKGYTKSAVKWG